MCVCIYAVCFLLFSIQRSLAFSFVHNCCVCTLFWRFHTHNVHNALHSLRLILLAWTHCIEWWSVRSRNHTYRCAGVWLCVCDSSYLWTRSGRALPPHTSLVEWNVQCSYCCSIEKFHSMLKNALLFQSQSLFLDFDTLLALRFALLSFFSLHCELPLLFSHPSLCSISTYSLCFSCSYSI